MLLSIFLVSTITMLIVVWNQIKATTPIQKAQRCNPSTFGIVRGRSGKCQPCKVKAGFVPSK
jgi:hypothetical protein